MGIRDRLLRERKAIQALQDGYVIKVKDLTK